MSRALSAARRIANKTYGGCRLAGEIYQLRQLRPHRGDVLRKYTEIFGNTSSSNSAKIT